MDKTVMTISHKWFRTWESFFWRWSDSGVSITIPQRLSAVILWEKLALLCVISREQYEESRENISLFQLREDSAGVKPHPNRLSGLQGREHPVTRSIQAKVRAAVVWYQERHWKKVEENEEVAETELVGNRGSQKPQRRQLPFSKFL